MIGPLKTFLRTAYLRLWRRTLESSDGRTAAADALRGLLLSPKLSALGESSPPYTDLGQAPAPRTRERDDLVFITARFRSGSTLLWNVFRHLPGCTAYYEPLNERRWFDDARRGDRVDASHRNVSDYWREYAGLGSLGKHFRERWNERDLYMDAAYWDPNLKRYLELLIEHAAGRPVLQFNRVDFRLSWLRANFPAARIVHLFRHPREQWMSTLAGDRSVPRDITPRQFAAHDGYYLLHWAHDLRLHFPFLDEREAEHPYQLFYYVWKLSYLFGAGHADYSLAFEHLIEHPREELGQLLAHLHFECASLEPLVQLIEAPQSGRWRAYADDAWFRRHEARCEAVLDDFLSVRRTADVSVS